MVVNLGPERFAKALAQMFNDEDDDDWMMGNGSSFEETYQCLPASDLLLLSLREAVEYGGKVILPGSALETISRLNVSYPLMFELENDNNQKGTHCGVLEFSAPEGTVYVPLWVMKTLGLRSGDFVNVSNVTLPLGQFTRLQPQSPDFLDITDPRAVLEHSLRNFSSLTRHDMIQINYNDKVYELEVMEVKPQSARHAISIVETDLQVDFDAPVGYVEPVYEKKSLAGSVGGMSLPTAFSPSTTTSTTQSSFKAFSGFGNRLNSEISSKTDSGSAGTGPKALKLPPGMLFFGGATPNKSTPPPPSFAEGGVKPFSGQGNKLK